MEQRKVHFLVEFQCHFSIIVPFITVTAHQRHTLHKNTLHHFGRILITPSTNYSTGTQSVDTRSIFCVS